ncbi:hypothetical protein C3K47_06590 [Solitalea longa]|uniref:Lipoprotein n=1 Tax=Solitalea longa TaxID=2079460 RepID=A0A2S5A4F2_9SPHI|nr:hypothetical protein [Solitalea longa]POY37425.1 hypothetical protein C3K47_06590 [Solitalea longa]
MKKFLLLVICSVFLFSCTKTVYVEKESHHKKGPPPHAKAWGVKKKQRVYYYYYPSTNVYFDVTFGKYVYFNAGAWVRVSTLPSTIIITNHERVRIDYTADDVYVYNSDHKTKYKKVPPGQAKKMNYDNDQGENHDNGNRRGKGKKKH